MKENKRRSEWGKGWDGKSRIPDDKYKKNYDEIDWSYIKEDKKEKKDDKEENDGVAGLVDEALDVATPPRAAMRVAMVDLRSWKRAKGGRRRVRPRGGGLERETIRLKLKLEL